MATAFVGITSGNGHGVSLELDVPADTVPGDTLIAAVFHSYPLYAPDGWTQLAGGADSGVWIGYRTAQFGDALTHKWTAGAAEWVNGCIVAYRGGAFDGFASDAVALPAGPGTMTTPEADGTAERAGLDIALAFGAQEWPESVDGYALRYASSFGREVALADRLIGAYDPAGGAVFVVGIGWGGNRTVASVRLADAPCCAGCEG